jgi:hypothetical protein
VPVRLVDIRTYKDAVDYAKNERYWEKGFLGSLIGAMAAAKGVIMPAPKRITTSFTSCPRHDPEPLIGLNPWSSPNLPSVGPR